MTKLQEAFLTSAVTGGVAAVTYVGMDKLVDDMHPTWSAYTRAGVKAGAGVLGMFALSFLDFVPKTIGVGVGVGGFMDGALTAYRYFMQQRLAASMQHSTAPAGYVPAGLPAAGIPGQFVAANQEYCAAR